MPSTQVPRNSDCRLLCPSRKRTILTQEFDLHHGRDEYPSDVSDTDCEDSCYITKKKPKNQRITFDKDYFKCFYRDTTYFGDSRTGYIPSAFSTRYDTFVVQPVCSVPTGNQERVDPAALPRVNDSLFPVPDTKRRYESSLPFGRFGIWRLGRAVAQARAVYIRVTVLFQSCIDGDSSNAAVARADSDTKQRLRNPEFQNEMSKLSPFFL